jgi:hypothetical protein
MWLWLWLPKREEKGNFHVLFYLKCSILIPDHYVRSLPFYYLAHCLSIARYSFMYLIFIMYHYFLYSACKSILYNHGEFPLPSCLPYWTSCRECWNSSCQPASCVCTSIKWHMDYTFRYVLVYNALPFSCWIWRESFCTLFAYGTTVGHQRQNRVSRLGQLTMIAVVQVRLGLLARLRQPRSIMSSCPHFPGPRRTRSECLSPPPTTASLAGT